MEDIDQGFLRMAKQSINKTSKNQGNIPEIKDEKPPKPEEIKKIEAYAVVDVVFMCDCTGSMGSYLEGSKDIIRTMIKDIKNKYTSSSVFVGFIAYRDHCDNKVLETLDLTSDFEEVYKFIDQLKADGGGDEPEAVVDGLHYAAKEIHWREEQSLRMLVHILDAPPHGREFGSFGDDHPNGCPCNYKYQELLVELDSKKIQYLILKCKVNVMSMITIFKNYHKDIEEIDIMDSLQNSNPVGLVYTPPLAGFSEHPPGFSNPLKKYEKDPETLKSFPYIPESLHPSYKEPHNFYPFPSSSLPSFANPTYSLPPSKINNEAMPQMNYMINPMVNVDREGPFPIFPIKTEAIPHQTLESREPETYNLKTTPLMPTAPPIGSYKESVTNKIMTNISRKYG